MIIKNIESMIKTGRLQILLLLVILSYMTVSCNNSIRFYNEIATTYEAKSLKKDKDFYFTILKKYKEELKDSDEIVFIFMPEYGYPYGDLSEVIFLYDVTNKKSYKFLLNEEKGIDSVSYIYDEKSYEVYILRAYLENRIDSLTKNNALKGHSGWNKSSKVFSVSLKEKKVYRFVFKNFAYKDGKLITEEEFKKIDF